MGEAYPELKSAQSQIQEVITLEEESFFRTLRRGGNLLQQVLKSSSSSCQISGEDAFKLKDTYGLPIDEISLLAKDYDYTVDMATFYRLEDEAKERSRNTSAKSYQPSNSISDSIIIESESEFIGYNQFSCDTFVEAIIHNGEQQNELCEGQEGYLILTTTPFYPEKGGQIGDKGEIFSSEGSFSVMNTTSPKVGLIVHQGLVTSGKLKKASAVTAQIDLSRRTKIANNHTGCHLLHKALELTLGSHIRQAGSYVDDTKIRLDFTHPRAISNEDLQTIEFLVNEKIRENSPVNTREELYCDIMNSPEIKQFFGDKYSDVVRVVSAGFSHELCGGTHASATGDLGYFRIVKEQAVSTGIRRIEAATGEEAQKLVAEENDTLNAVAALLQTPKDQILSKLKNLVDERKKQTKLINDLENKLINSHLNNLVKQCQKVNDIFYLAYHLEKSEAHYLQQYANCMHEKISKRLVSLWTTEKSDKYIILARISSDLNAEGLRAQDLLKTLLTPYGGRWGGKDLVAQGSAPTLPSIDVLNQTLAQWILTQLV
ncbi:threonyl and Alanyl tRNA synthetase second additional domain protein [Chlamydia ibidis 10-1398/6]|nr:threonyl and Alanyl tRNA synthetase second additional domain protein [Chlamydia ibidis 10-1398/6]